LEITDGDYIQTYLDRIANVCQLNHSPMVPDGGDCGFYILSFVLLKNPQFIKRQNKYRELLGIHNIFPAKETQNIGLINFPKE